MRLPFEHFRARVTSYGLSAQLQAVTKRKVSLACLMSLSYLVRGPGYPLPQTRRALAQAVTRWTRYLCALLKS